MRVTVDNVDKVDIEIHQYIEPEFESLSLRTPDGTIHLFFPHGGVGAFARRILALQPPVAKREASNV